MKIKKDYHELYSKCNVLLLANVLIANGNS